MKTPKTRDTSRTTLSKLVANVRQSNGWTLRQLSAKVGIPLSTLAKVEGGKLSMNYEKLFQFTNALGLTMAEFLAGAQAEAGGEEGKPVITGRRSLTEEANTVNVNTASYDYEYLCSDLREKLMLPILSRVHAKSLEEFGPLVQHDGEEFVFVLEGTIEVHLQLYTPTVITAGRGIYIDSSMGHAYLAKDCDYARILTVCSNHAQTLQSVLIEQAARRNGAAVETAPSPAEAPRQPKATAASRRRA